MKRTPLGFILLLMVIILWVGSSTLIQEIFESVDFNKPFFLTYFSTSMFSFYLISWFWKRKLLINHTIPDIKTTVKIALGFCPLWFFANYLFNLSLGLTSVASNTILSSTSGMITFVLSIFLLKETAEIFKFIAVFTTMGGVVCISLSDDQGGADGLLGDFFAVLGAFVYGLYSIYIKAKAKNVDIVLFFGCVGACNVVLLFPGFIILNYSGIEVFELPSGEALGLLFLNALFGTVLSDILWALSVKFLNPALCTVGISLTIPLSMVVDTVLHQSTYSILYIIGALFIIFGFVIMSLYENPQIKQKITNKVILSRLRYKKELFLDDKARDISLA